MACASVESPISRSSSSYPWGADPTTSPPPYEYHAAYPAVSTPSYPIDTRSGVEHRPTSVFAQTDPSRGSGTRRAQGQLSIPHLREALNSLESKMASLLNERDMLESRLEQAVRLQSPVQRLPTELLSSIFVTAVLGSGEDLLMLSTVMLVCRHWNNVALDTPLLWSRVVAGTRHSLVKARRKLERSKSAPLHICVDFSPRMEHTSVSTESIANAMELLRTSIWRWKTFRLIVPNRPQAHAALMLCRDEAPQLELLSVRILHSMQDDHYSHHPPLPLFNGRTPSLQYCSFTSFNFAWDLRLVTGLRVLKLGGYWNGFSPSVDAVLAILRACPQLEEFALRNVSDVDPDPCARVESDPSEHEGFAERSVRVSDTRMVQLPRLKKASFYYSGILRTRTILSLMSFPSLERIELCFLDDVSPALEHLRRQSLTHLPLKEMRIESSFFSELRLVRLLRRLPSLSRLELIDVEDASSDLLKSLSTPPTAQTWVCPKLTTLYLEGCTTLDWEALRGFVESRLPAHSRAYPRQMPPLSAPATPFAVSSTSGNRLYFPSTTTTSSASAFAVNAHILAHTPVTSQSKASSSAVGWPQRLQFIDLTRCHQISKEMVQWLRMYVAEVRCENAKGVWGEPTMT
ncbi:hypothetical protein C8Q75DRAFT_717980 [Abortiporus biennis]|nr:hypothetical protein C8Q75DRAFT_717980 [Abortiporus biennis]